MEDEVSDVAAPEVAPAPSNPPTAPDDAAASTEQVAPIEAAAPVEEAAPTGVPAADAALERLGDLATAPLDDHVEIFDDVQRRLHQGLAELDDEQ
jgi:hypothetical protein